MPKALIPNRSLSVRGVINPTAGMMNGFMPLFTECTVFVVPLLTTTVAFTVGSKNVAAKTDCDPGQYGPMQTAAGLAKIALMASWGDATPAPPMAREAGATPIRVSPLVAWAAGKSSNEQRISVNSAGSFPIGPSIIFYLRPL
jgi:hypothetical protein